MPWFDVHDRVADVQLRQVLDQRVDVADLLLLARAGARRRASANSSVSVTKSIAPRSRSSQRSPAASGAAAMRELLVAGLELGERVDARRLDAGCRAAARAGSRAGPRSRRRSARGAACCREVRLQLRQRLVGAAVDARGRAAARRPVGVRRRRSSPRSASCACALGAARRTPPAVRNSASGGSSGRSRSCCRKRWRSRVSVQKRCSAASSSPCSASVASRAEVVEDGRGLVEEQRQVVLDAGRRDAVADVLVDAAPWSGRLRAARASARGSAVRAASSIGNSRPGSRRTSGTG